MQFLVGSQENWLLIHVMGRIRDPGDNTVVPAARAHYIPYRGVYEEGSEYFSQGCMRMGMGGGGSEANQIDHIKLGSMG